MDAKAKKLKDIIKTAAVKPTFGTNPMDPWSAKAGIAESAMLNRYLKSKGINPEFVPAATKISHAKSNQFKMWVQNHRNEEVQIEDMGKTAERAHALSKQVNKHKEIKTPPTSMQTIRKEEHNNCGTPDCCGQCDAVEQIDESDKRHAVSTHLSKMGIGSHWRDGNTLAVHDNHVDKVQKFMDKHTGGYVNVVGHSDHPDIKEDVYQDPQAATQTVFDGANNTNDLAEKRKQLSKSARMIKALYRKHRMSEDTYDWEKADKSVATYGKKPKMATADDKEKMGENKPKAAAVMSGGTTLTGQPRDTVEIDPMMRVRPGQPDPTKKDDKKKDDKKKEDKKDK